MDRSSGLLLAVACVAGVVVAVGWVVPHQGGEYEPGGARIGNAPSSPRIAPRPRLAPARRHNFGLGSAALSAGRSETDSREWRLPASLRGTDPPAGIQVDWRGHMVPTPAVIGLFDYFLSASGEEPDAIIRDRIIRHIRNTLSEPAASEMVEVFEDYLRLRGAVRDAVDHEQAPSTPEDRWQWLHDLRHQAFGEATATALFGKEEEVARLDLASWRGRGDASLDAEEQAARLAALEEQLPEDIRDARRRIAAPLQAHREVEALRSQGAAEDRIFAARARRFGSEAAERLAALDRRRAEWQGRLGRYQAARDAVLSKMLPGQSAERAIEALRAAHFDAAELPRIRALDRAALR